MDKYLNCYKYLLDNKDNHQQEIQRQDKIDMMHCMHRKQAC